MNPNEIVITAGNRFNVAVERLTTDLKGLRTGRASASMLDTILVEVYGATMPIKQLAAISVPEAQMIVINPYDPNNLQAIVAAIRNSQGLGLNPSDDGRVIRLVVPPLTEERRRAIAKQIGDKTEECMVRMRSVRHDAIDEVNKFKKEKLFGEDDCKRLEKQIEDLMSIKRREIEKIALAKEEEILKI